MRLRRGMVVFAATLLGAGVASDTLAGRGGGHSGGGHGGGHVGAHSGHFSGHGGHFVPRFRTRVFIGGSLFAPFYYYPTPFYYYPPVEPDAPAYIEQYPSPVAPPQSSYWYYCSSSNSYYPYVKECPEGWQQVAPQPPS